MTRRTLFIIIGALAVAALIIASWFWLFSRGTANQQLFGGGGNKTGTTTASGGQQTNIPSGGSNTGNNTNVPTGSTNTSSGGLNGSGGVNGGNTGGTNIPLDNTGVPAPGSTGINTDVPGGAFGESTGVATVPGVEWLGDTGGGTTGGGTTGGGNTSTFTPSGVNQLNNGATGGQVTIFGTPSAASNSSDYGALFAAAGIGVALCTATPLISSAVGGLATSLGLSVVTGAVQVNATAQNIANANTYQRQFLDCITRTVGRAIVNQITASVVNWINSGFKGQPSFVQNYQQFFANVADLAAGEYIKGSALSFLCSPFQLQVRIAIAQSYANRNAGASCSISQVSNNVQNFMNGNFSAGGWPALLNFASVPTNNAFGAYSFAQIGLATAQSNALQNANRNITPGGFISYVQAYDCQASVPSGSQRVGFNGQLTNNSSLFLTPTQSAAGSCPSNCKCRTATPGSIIESTLIGTENSTLNQLNLAKSFDEIISALITQLMTRTLQQGLSNLSGQNGYQSNFLTPDQQQAQNNGNALLTQLSALSIVSQQYGQTQQGMVGDLQNSQQQLATLLNCWESADKSAQASTTADTINELEVQVGVRNNNITRANASISAIQQLQTQTLAVTSSSDVSAVTQNIQAATNSGVIITQDDLSLSQQDRVTLQSQLAARNTQTSSDLAQCRAASQ